MFSDTNHVIVAPLLNFHSHSNYLFEKKLTVLQRLAKATTQTHFLPPFFSNNDLGVDPANFRRSGREWSGGATVHFCVSGRLLLPFSPTIALPFKASDCGCAQGFKAVPFCSFYSRQTMAPLVGLLCRQELDTIVVRSKSPHLFWHGQTMGTKAEPVWALRL